MPGVFSKRQNKTQITKQTNMHRVNHQNISPKQQMAEHNVKIQSNLHNFNQTNFPQKMDKK